MKYAWDLPPNNLGWKTAGESTDEKHRLQEFL